MSVKYTERRSTVLNDILRIIVTHLALNEHRTNFEISRKLLEEESWRDVEITWAQNFERDTYTVQIRDKRKFKLTDGIVDAEYEIISEPPKLLTDGSHDE
jgi:hypothetical protein